MPKTGPILIAYDGSAASEQALREAAALFAPRAALVVVVWEAGVAFDAGVSAMGTVVEPGPLDLEVAFELEDEGRRRAERLAGDAAAVARECGLDAEPLAVSDATRAAYDVLLDVARDRDAQVIVVGSHGHSAVGKVLFGHTAHEILSHADCPVLVVRAPNGEG